MRFKITSHSGLRSPTRPADAMDLLWERLGAKHGDATFARVGAEIWANWGEDVLTSMGGDERSEIGRLAILNVVREACESAPGLELDWFAVNFDP
jgi:hypothetical protein